MNYRQDVRWYRRRRTYVLFGFIVIFLLVVWFWRDWVGLGTDSAVQVGAADAFKQALDVSATEATTFQKNGLPNGSTFYIPDYTDGSGSRNQLNLDSLFVYFLNQEPSMPLSHVKSIDILAIPTMQFTAKIQYATWLGMTKTVVYSGNLPVPHKK